jgi:FMN reductase
LRYGEGMANVLTLNGSPSLQSRTQQLLLDLGAELAREGHQVTHLSVRDLPAEDLLYARSNATAIAAASQLVASAQGIVVGTPIYKAAYSGILKAFLDLLPQFAFEGKTVLPLATGGTVAHVLALDYGLRPVLSSLGARHIVGSHFVLDKAIRTTEAGKLELDAEIASKYRAAVAAFTDSLSRHSEALQAEPRLVAVT